MLDTEGVNAFAAPGGFIHITKGLLGLMKNEAELAEVLAHEITHVTEKHTVDSLQKSKAGDIAASESGLKDSKVFSRIVDTTTEMVLSGFGRNEELQSDREGLRLADKMGTTRRASASSSRGCPTGTRPHGRNRGSSPRIPR